MKTVKLNKKAVEKLFDTHDNNSIIVSSLYEMVYGKETWAQIKSVDGHCQCSEACNKEIFRLFIQFDKEHHPNVMNGGTWMNYGFSSLDSEIEDTKHSWVITPAPVTLQEGVPA